MKNFDTIDPMSPIPARPPPVDVDTSETPEEAKDKSDNADGNWVHDRGTKPGIERNIKTGKWRNLAPNDPA